MKFLSDILVKAGLTVENTFSANAASNTIYAGAGTRLRTEANNMVFERVSSSGFMKFFINQTTLAATAKSYLGYSNATLNVVLSNEHTTGGLELRTQDIIRQQIFSNGNIVIGQASPVDAGYKVDITGSLKITGVGTSTAINYLVQDSAAAEILKIQDSGTVTITKGALLANNTTVTHRMGLLQITGAVINGLTTIQISSAGGQSVNFPGSNLFFAAEQLWNLSTFTPLNLVRNGVSFTANWTNSGAGIGSTGNAVVANISTSQSLGTNFLNNFSVKGTIATTGGNTTFRGFYYDPTITSSTGLTNIAFESTSGIVKISTLAGTGTRMVVADSSGVLSTQAIPSGNAGTVTSIATTGPITGGTITSTGTIGITQATSSTDGYLSSTDWNAFNSKQAALGFTPVTNARTITINGTAYDLTSDRSWSVGTVTGSGSMGYVPKWATSSDLTNGMMYDAGTAVLIGTQTTSSAKFMVYSASADNHYQAIGSGPSFRFADTIVNPNYTGIIALVTSASQFITGAVAGDMVLANNTTSSIGNFIFGTGATERMRITPAGNVSINNTNNTFRLDVNGTGRFTGQLRLESTITNGTYTYTLPGATGTLALTSQLSSFITLTSLSASSPLSYNNTTGAFSISQASGSTNGFLSSTDWTTFNNKQNALTNPVTGTGTTNYLPKFTGTSTIGDSLIFDNGTNVGIGTAIPTKKLDIVTNTSQDGIRITGSSNPRLTIIDSTNNVQFDVLTTDTEAVLRTDTNHPLHFSTNGTLRATLDTSGNLGLGVTPSAWGTFTALQVGNAATWSTGTNNSHWSSNTYYDGTNRIYIGSDFATEYAQQSGAHKWFTAPSGTAGGTITATQAMTLDASGNLAIGTTSASSRLHVVGTSLTDTFRITDAANYTIVMGYAGSGNTGLISTLGGTASLALGTNSTARLTIASTGAATFSSSVTAKSTIAVSNNGAEAPILSATSTFADGYRATLRLNNTHTGGKQWDIYSTNNSDGGYSGGKLAFVNATDGVTALTMVSGGNVGIGSTSPSYKLDVVNAGTNTIRVQNTSNTSDAYLLAQNTLGSTFFGINATGGYIYNGAALPILFYTSGSEQMRLNASGNLSIGNTNDTYKLDVSGTGIYRKSGDSRLIIYETGAAPYTATLELASQAIGTYGATIQYTSNAENLTIETYGRTSVSSTFGDINFRTKVGNTTPTNILNLDGFTGAATFSSSVTAGSGLFGSDFLSNETSKVGIAFESGYGKINAWGANTSTYGGLKFQISASNGGTATPLIITPSGNVGIGTTSPTTYKLQIDGAAGIISSSNAAIEFGIRTPDATFNDSYLIFGTATNNRAQIQVTGSSANTGSMIFTTYNAGAGAERMRITSGGFVGIGTSGPSYLLDVNGTGRFITSGNNIGIFESTNTNGGYITFRRSGNDFLYIGNSSAVGGGANMTDFYTTAGLGMRFFPNAGGAALTLATTGAATFSVGALFSADATLLNSDNSIFRYTNNYMYVQGTTAGGLWLAGGSTRNNNIAIREASNTLSFYTNGNENLVINPSGNVGIGTTSPAYKLDVSGTTRINGGDGLLVRASTGETANFFVSPSTGATYIDYVGFMAFRGSSEFMRITSGGTLSINSTAGPVDSANQKLHVYGAIRQDVIGVGYGEGIIMNFPTGGTTYGGLFMHSTAANSAVGASTIKWQMTYNYAPEIGLGAGGLAFTTANTNTRLFLTSGGNVGIGTTSPATLLDIYGSLYASLMTSRLLDSANFNDSPGGGIGFGGKYTSGGAVTEFGIIRGVKENTTDGNYAGFLQFQTRPHNGSWAERMRITSGGDVLVNATATTQGAKFYVNGIGAFGQVYAGNLGTGALYSNAGFLTNTNPSDFRLKNTIKPLTYGLNEVLQLNPKTFYYNDDATRARLKYGFIAQEVKEVMPDMVRLLGNEDYLGLEQDGIWVTLVNAIKEQQAQIEQLKSQLNK